MAGVTVPSLSTLQLDPDEPLPLTLLGQPVLHTRATEVTTFDAALEALVEAMFETMYAAPGVGLAAPQVGLGLRVFVFDCGGPVGPGVVVNPVCERVGTDLQDGGEGCLSVPGLDYPTPRALHARVTGFDQFGKPVEYEGSELLARCFQHETDHLDGYLYVDRLGGKVRKQAMKDVKECAWYGDAHRRLVRGAPPVDDEDPESEL
jgi:peptide deformylase